MASRVPIKNTSVYIDSHGWSDDDCSSSGRSSSVPSVRTSSVTDENESISHSRALRTPDVFPPNWHVTFDSSYDSFEDESSSDTGGAAASILEPSTTHREELPREDEEVEEADEDSAIGDAPSVGTVAHGTGSCKPCAFWAKAVCILGSSCRNCHIFHADHKYKRLRLPKHKRDRIKALARAAGSEGSMQAWHRSSTIISL